jgi:hypothetical protein
MVDKALDLDCMVDEKAGVEGKHQEFGVEGNRPEFGVEGKHLAWIGNQDMLVDCTG